jgi:hypothetical protein
VLQGTQGDENEFASENFFNSTKAMVDVSIFADDNAAIVSEYFFGNKIFPKEIFCTIDLYLDKLEENESAPELVATHNQETILRWVISNSLWTMEQLNRCLYETMEQERHQLSQILFDELEHFEYFEEVINYDILTRAVRRGDLKSTQLFFGTFIPNNYILNQCISLSPSVEVLKEVLDALDCHCDTFNPCVLVKFTLHKKHRFVEMLLERFWTDATTLSVCLGFAEGETLDVLLNYGAQEE